MRKSSAPLKRTPSVEDDEISICDIVVENVSTEISDDNENRKVYEMTNNLIVLPYFGQVKCKKIIYISLITGISLSIAGGIALIVAFVGVSKLYHDVAQIQSIDDRVTSVLTGMSVVSSGCLENISNISSSESIQMCFFNQIFSKITENSNITQVAVFVDVLKETGYPFASCAAIQNLSPSSPSGIYHIRSSNGSAVRLYCDMTRSCGNITGGWMRVAELDTRDNTVQCPLNLRLNRNQLRTCRTMDTNSALCSSDKFTVGVRYSKVCGRIRAYQVGTPHAFGYSNPNDMSNSGRGTDNTNIDTYYVDGISLTHGQSKKEHIWTFVGANNEDSQDPNLKCPCINTAISTLVPPFPSFVGNDYFCDTATESGSPTTFNTNDPLWDGAGCGPQNTCCSYNNPPWFYKQLPKSTTDDIEMRVCRDQGTNDEDFAIEVVEIYVQQ